MSRAFFRRLLFNFALLAMANAGVPAATTSLNKPASPTPAVALKSAADAKLTELEMRAAAENGFPNLNPVFHQEVVELINANMLMSGEDFFRAANLASTPFPEFRSARMSYELTLAAIARDEKRAELALTTAWDILLSTLGRSQRFDKSGIVADDSDGAFKLDAAPAVVATVWRHPEEARIAASKTENHSEVQQIVDADQAVRANFGNLSAEEIRAMQDADRKRNARIRAIVAEGSLHTAQDFANAALVIQHSAAFAGYELAHELAVCALLLGDRQRGRWLVAATYDRMLCSVGHDQRFGTQGITRNGKTVLRDIDESGICDAERIALGCPTLAAKRANFNTRAP